MPLTLYRPTLILALFLTLLALPSAHAQSATSRTTNLFSRTATEWSGDFFVGSNTSHHVLTVNNGGMLSNDKAFVGYSQESANNQVILSGKGSRWNCEDCAVIGYRGGNNSLLIANGATLSSGSSTNGRKTPEPHWEHGWVGFWSEGNTALVTGQDSVWIAKGLCIGEWGKKNSLRIEQGGAVFSQEAWIGRDPNANDNQVTVTGNHSLWRNSGGISVGRYGLNCSLDILDNATVVAGNVAVGEFLDTLGQSTPLGHSILRVNGGTLLVTNAIGNACLSLGESPSQIIIDDGTTTVDRIVVNPGTWAVYPQYGPNLLLLNGGSLSSKGTTIANGQPFPVGDGVHAASFRLLGGTHSFANGFCVRSNAVLTGAGNIVGVGTINGSAQFDKGSSVLDGPIVNNGRIEAANGATLTFNRPVINNGTIVWTNDAIQFKQGVSGPGSLSILPTRSRIEK